MALPRLNVLRPPRGCLILLGVALLCSVGVSAGQAQHLGTGIYGKLGAGLSGYTGDLSGAGEAPRELDANVLKHFPLTAAGELGYQFSPNWALALGGQAGSYVSVGDAAPATDSYRRYTSHLLGRYTFGAPSQRVAFYLDAGLNVTVGGPTRTGIGPSVGGGMDIRASRAVSIFVESRLHAVFPDDAVDGTETAGGGGRSFDTVNQPLGIGLKFSLTTPTAPDVVALDGPLEVPVDTAVTFAATVNEDEAARPLDRQWRFGDGTRGTGPTATHTYGRPGTYTVSFAARNEAGTATESTTIRVTRASDPPSTPDAPWIVSLTARPNPVSVGEPVQLRSVVRGGEPFAYRWTVGDETVERGPEPTVTFERPGRHPVRVRVSNDAGTETRAMTVHAERPEGHSARAPAQAVGWAIGVASMRSRAGAERMARRYRERLADAVPGGVRIVEHVLDQTRHFRVVVGRYETQAAAQRVLEDHRRALPSGAWAVQLQ
ncbi:MAG: PKD domain-containing protein [Salinibacter sp.]|uniref:PKD domain-containing protein n=1 Tax=Salinibacter sp. TaxID=2065818 RepID=UPI002FC3C8C9